MNFSTVLMAPLLAQGSMAAIAVMVDFYAGGIANEQYVAWYWDGGIVDDFANHTPKTTCELRGSHGSTCELSGYKVTLNSAVPGGCNHGSTVGDGKPLPFYSQETRINPLLRLFGPG